MAVPWINLLAPSMGGIGPIELVDVPKLNELKAKNGVPFYAGRFYPKDSQSIISELNFGLISETPPWLCWEPILSTQIWMVPVLEDERIISTNTQVVRIDVWPRDEETEEDIGSWENTTWDDQMQGELWGNINLGPFAVGPTNDTIDPGIIVQQNSVPPVLFAGYVGISTITGYVSEYGFYDQEFMTVNGLKYGQAQYQGKARQYNEDKFLNKEEEYQEIWRYRSDGIWVKKDADLNSGGKLEFPIGSNGYPSGGYFKEVNAADRSQWVISDKTKAKRYGNDKWDFYTQVYDGEGGLCKLPSIGVFSGYRPTKLDTIVYTIKVSCQTIVVPDDPTPGSVKEALKSYSNEAAETFGSNLTNNVWFFYMPVRYNGNLQAERTEYLLQRAAINISENLLCKVE